MRSAVDTRHLVVYALDIRERDPGFLVDGVLLVHRQPFLGQAVDQDEDGFAVLITQTVLLRLSNPRAPRGDT